MAKPRFTYLFTASVLLLTGALSACAPGAGLAPAPTNMDAQAQQGPDGLVKAPQKAFNRFPDIPVPTNATMDVKRTIVFGSGESWYGQLGLDARHGVDELFDFYKQELPGFDWQEITAVRALVSIMTYERQGRVLSIQLEKATLGGTKATLTVSPRGGQAPTLN